MAINERLRQDADRYDARGTNHAPVPDFEVRSNGSLASKGKVSRGFLDVGHGETVKGTGKTARNRVRGR